MEVEAAFLGVDVGNIGQVGPGKIVPVGGPDLRVNHSGSGAATDRGARTGEVESTSRRVGTF